MSFDWNSLPNFPIASNVAARLADVDAEGWLAAVHALHDSGARFLTLWGSDDRDRDACFRIYSTWLLPDGIQILTHAIADLVDPTYPSISSFFPAAARMQRAVRDLLGISALTEDPRGWHRHSGWPGTVFPLRRDFSQQSAEPAASVPYPFVQVEGEGVHEIVVGPVHAGIIEPGNFRFSVVGEKVLRLEERLGYTHKGVAKCFQGMSQAEGHRLAARASGDSAVANSWAYCAALESITQTECPPRALHLRALALEHERLANHLGDLGALGNDAGFAFGLTQFSALKENLLRINSTLFGARYLMDYVVPGGVASDLPAVFTDPLSMLYSMLEQRVTEMRSIYDNHAGIQDRFRETGRLDAELACRLGALGLAGRASGIANDLRADLPWPPYTQLQARIATQSYGDVAARVQVRFDEIFESLRLCRVLIGTFPEGSIRVVLPIARPNRLGLGTIEGWRGPVALALETGNDGAIRTTHAHDPSWQNWPLLEYAILGNLVPDFPLINKSFNLSYSGQDG